MLGEFTEIESGKKGIAQRRPRDRVNLTEQAGKWAPILSYSLILRFHMGDIAADIRCRFGIGTAESVLHCRNIFPRPLRQWIVDGGEKFERRCESNIAD